MACPKEYVKQFYAHVFRHVGRVCGFDGLILIVTVAINYDGGRAVA